VEDFLVGLEKGEAEIPSGRSDAAPTEESSASQPHQAPIRTLRTTGGKDSAVVHLPFKKVAFWPVLAMGIIMLVVAFLSVKEMLTARQPRTVPTTAQGLRLEGGWIIDGDGNRLGQGKVKDGYLVMISADGQEWDMGQVRPAPIRMTKGRPAGVFAVAGFLLGILLLLAAYVFRRQIMQARESEGT